MMNRIESLLKDCHGATAVEFAFIAPIMLTLVFGIVAYGSIISVNNGLQQLAGEAAKASLAGLTDPDRTQLAKAFVTANAPFYAFMDSTKLKVDCAEPKSSQFQVLVSYDMSNSMAFHLLAWLPLPPAKMTRNAVIERGGF